MKPLDSEMLARIAQNHRMLITVEDGTVVNGFGAFVAATVESLAPDVRVALMGVPDRTFEHAPRSRQLAEVGLTAEGIAAKVRACAAEESLSTA